MSKSGISFSKPIGAALPEDYYVHVDRLGTGVDPNRSMPSTAPSVDWTKSTSDPADSIGVPLLDTGDTLWTYRTGGARRMGRLDADDGSVVWESNAAGNNRSTCTPLIGNLVIYFQDEGLVQAFNVDDGTLEWQNDVVDVRGIEGNAVSNGELVVLGLFSDRTGVLALDLDDGSEVWHHDPADVGDPGNTQSAFTYKDGVFFCPMQGNGARILALDETDGSRIWEGPNPGSVCTGGAHTGDGEIVHTAAGGGLASNTMFVVDEATGAEIRRFNIAETQTLGTPILSGSNAYIGTDNGTDNASYEGWNWTDGSNIFSRSDRGSIQHNGFMDAAGNILFADQGNGFTTPTVPDEVHYLDPSDGSFIWTVDPGNIASDADAPSLVAGGAAVGLGGAIAGLF